MPLIAKEGSCFGAHGACESIDQLVDAMELQARLLLGGLAPKLGLVRTERAFAAVLDAWARALPRGKTLATRANAASRPLLDFNGSQRVAVVDAVGCHGLELARV